MSPDTSFPWKSSCPPTNYFLQVFQHKLKNFREIFLLKSILIRKRILWRINFVLIKFLPNALLFEKLQNECKNLSFLHKFTCIRSDLEGTVIKLHIHGFKLREALTKQIQTYYMIMELTKNWYNAHCLHGPESLLIINLARYQLTQISTYLMSVRHYCGGFLSIKCYVHIVAQENLFDLNIYFIVAVCWWTLKGALLEFSCLVFILVVSLKNEWYFHFKKISEPKNTEVLLHNLFRSNEFQYLNHTSEGM